MANLVTLHRRRGAIKAKMATFSKFFDEKKKCFSSCDAAVQNSIIIELQIRLEKTNEVWTQFQELQEEIEALEEDFEAQLALRETFESSYYSNVALVKQFLEENDNQYEFKNDDAVSEPSCKSSKCSHGSQSYENSSSISLPKLPLPTFSGSFEEWPAFADTFKSVIHENETLTEIAKFRYLKGSLQGEAAQTIQGLVISAENYQTAWSILVKRYENKKIMVFNHIKSLMEFEKIQRESFSQLRKLLDNVYTNTRALTVLGQPVDKWDTLLIYLISEKLDNYVANEWEKQTVTSTELPTLQEFLDFLEDRCQRLQRMDKSYKSQTTKGLHNKTMVHLNTSIGSNCKLCKANHALYQCPEFIKKNANDRFFCIKQLKLCINCLRPGHHASKCKSNSKCRKCNKDHNTMLHKEEAQEKQEIKQDERDSCDSTQTVNAKASLKPSQILLATAVVKVKDKYGNWQKARALLDSGSQSNFVTTKFAEIIQNDINKAKLTVTGISENQTLINNSTNLEIHSDKANFKKKMEFLIMPKITCHLPTTTINIKNLPEVELADENYDKPGEIDLLIGAESYLDILLNEKIRLGNGLPILQKTVLGWIISGPVARNTSHHKEASVCFLSANKSLENSIEQFWKIEEFAEIQHFSKEELECEAHFANTHTRDATGRFVVCFPLKTDPTCLGESKENAIKRLEAYERKASKDPVLQEQYSLFMKEYENLGHMAKVRDAEDTKMVNYLPHHAVFKQSDETRKIRVVFDASSKTTSQLSLNDILMVGPTIQQNLFAIITRFRQHRYVLTGDIVKMYRQILMNAEERNLQRIIWRENSDQPIQEYKLNTVTYGTASAPFLATRSLQQLAKDNMGQYPKTCEIILNDFYVDDLLTGNNNITELKKTKDELIKIMHSGGFHLDKWMSNCPQLFDEGGNSTILSFFEENDKTIRTLGVNWNPCKDTITYQVTEDPSIAITKRQILIKISKLFDPLGLLGPIIVKAKLVMQRLWQLKSHWDEPVPSSIFEEWKIIQENLNQLNHIQIQRYLFQPNFENLQLHGFADASEHAYGAVIYVRSTEANDNIARIVCSKSRVAPLKKISLPRLELCAALLLAQLLKTVKNAFNLDFKQVFLWSDSTITLWWINTEPHKLKTFIANRVSEIQKITEAAQWRHISSSDNPADLISRGCLPQNIQENISWWNGPSWLHQEESNWPEPVVKATPKFQDTILELKPTILTCTTTTVNCNLLQKFSNWKKLQRVIAYCYRFINHATKRVNILPRTTQLTIEELEQATRKIISLVQKEDFSREINDLTANNTVDKKSKLVRLNPKLDENLLIRVGGRIENAEVSIDQKHPYILPKNHHITYLITKEEHERLLHCSQEQLLAAVRMKFWPLAGRQMAKKVVKSCLTCFKRNPRVAEHIMGDLPKTRVTATQRPFLVAGVDYAGPILVKEGRRRGKQIVNKAYLCIFVCFTTKAIHVEVVSNLTSDNFIAALKRFIARRGICQTLYSDNGTNFVGANQKLKEVYEFLRTNEETLTEELAKQKINWKFIPPRSPHFGGLWESAVKAVKNHLLKITNSLTFTFEELNTLVIEIEAILNSRPLTPLSDSPDDLIALTPSHFLIGDILVHPVEECLSQTPENRLNHWQRLQQIRQHFWQRWHREYLHQLQVRGKWHHNVTKIQLNTMVLVIEDNLPSQQWLLGRVTATFPGSDGIVRVVMVKTKRGEMKRPVKKLCPLPSEVSSAVQCLT